MEYYISDEQLEKLNSNEDVCLSKGKRKTVVITRKTAIEKKKELLRQKYESDLAALEAPEEKLAKKAKVPAKKPVNKNVDQI